MKIVKTPNVEFTGTRAGVAFSNGVGQTDDDAALVSFRRHGYIIEDAKDSDEDPLGKLTIDELKAHAAELGVDLGDASKKADIRAAIDAAGQQD